MRGRDKDQYMANPTLREYLRDHPELEQRWSPSNKKSLLDLTTGSNKKAQWVCSKCGDEREYTINTVVKKPETCSVCSGRVIVVGINDLSTTNPELVMEWGADNDSSPHEHTRSSPYVANWVCSLCGNSWKAPVNNRSRSDYQSGCRSCNLKRKKHLPTSRTLPHGEDVPEFMRLAYQESGINQTIGSKKERSWVCPSDPSHTWTESPFRLSKRLSCPHCENLIVTEKGKISLRASLSSVIPAEKSLCSFLKPSAISISSAQRVTWICDKGHIWVTPVYQRTLGNVLSECMYCADRGSSSGERELREFVEELLPGKVVSSSRKIIPPYELDIYIPEKNVAVEFNGLYRHSEKFVDKNYHHDKWNRCHEQGVRLITIWEDEWLNKKDIVTSMLTHKLGESTSRKVFARNTEVVESTIHDSREFLDDNHIQGFAQGSFYLSLVSGSEIIAVSVWKKNRSTLYLERYATSATVVGGMGKLLKAGIRYAKERGCSQIVTFADHQVSDGGLYEKLGFRLDKELKPDYRYVVGGERVHKFNYRLKRFRDDPSLEYVEGMSECELARLNNIPRVYDCGKARYVYDIPR